MSQYNQFTTESISTTRKPNDQKIFYRVWKGSSSQVLIYLHGVQSHSEWIKGTGVELSKKGFTVYAPDRRGSGQSGYSSGEISDFSTLLQDMREFIHFVQMKEPGKKVHLIGLCWGARLCLPLSLEKELKLASVVLLSPGLFPLVDYSIAEKIKIGWMRLTRSPQKIPLPLKDDFFTQNPHYLDFIRTDPFSLREVSAQFLFETLKLNRQARHSLKKVRIPLMVLLAGKDRIVNTGRSFKAFAEVPSKLKKIKIYPESQHTLEFEEKNLSFFNDLERWFKRWENSVES